jgi:hypothetical protein
MAVGRDRLPGQEDKVRDVGGDDRSLVGRGEFELRSVAAWRRRTSCAPIASMPLSRSIPSRSRRG